MNEMAYQPQSRVQEFQNVWSPDWTPGALTLEEAEVLLNDVTFTIPDVAPTLEPSPVDDVI